MSTISDYLDKLPVSQRQQLERVRQISLDYVPEAEDTISYGMPALKLDGYGIIWYAGFKNHMSVFPGTIHFTEEEPISQDDIKKVIDGQLQRMRERQINDDKKSLNKSK